MSEHRFSFKRTYALLIKEFIQLRRDRVSYGMILALPLALLLVLGYSINSDPHHLPTAVLSHNPGNFSNTLISALERSEYFDVQYLPQTEEELNKLINDSKVIIAITIPQDFTRRVIKQDKAQVLIEADASDPAAISNALGIVPQLIHEALKFELKGALAPDKIDPNLQILSEGQRPFEMLVHRLYNPENITVYKVLPGLLGVVLSLILVLMTALAVTRERERGTLESLLATPANSVEIMIGKLSPYILVGLLQTVIFLVIASLLFEVPMPESAASWLALACGAFLFIIGNLCLGYLISTVAKTQLQAMQMSVFYIIPSIFLSGFAFPFNGMPIWARFFGEILPITHFIRIARGALLKQQVLANLSTDILILGIFVCFISFVAIMRSQTTLD